MRVCVSPVLCVCSLAADVVVLVLLSSSRMPESKQIASCLTDFKSGCDDTDADDDDTCCVTSAEEADGNHGQISIKKRVWAGL